ncbi:MAG TPA: matrixin family metalloprotease [Bryobacteraceae bacterium]
MGHRIGALVAGFLAASSIASAYYSWVYFANVHGSLVPVPARFDLNALNNNTVEYFISDQPPLPMQGDTVQAIISQIRAAADVWNQIPSSTIRIAFGGISTIGATAQATPGVDVVFNDDLPPGLLAQTWITVPSDLSFINQGASFVPILRSRVQLPYNFAARGLWSYSDEFFLTVAHEFGHSMGLQHSLTSALMSTQLTRATTKAAPIAPDDIAGISLLYPTQNFASSTGAISGAVLLNGAGVTLASVVALSANGTAISSLTNPNGTYTISGIPPGQYYVYAQPLPPPATGEAYPDNVIPPEDSQGNPFLANTGIDTEFYPGTKNWTQARQISVTAGGNASGIVFNMQSRASVAIPYATTVGYQGALEIYSPPLAANAELPIVFYAPGTTANGNLVPGLNVSVVGGIAPLVAGSLEDYSDPYGSFYVNTPQVSTVTPAALAFELSNDLYVLAVAFTIVPGPPPSISSVTPTNSVDSNGDPVVTIAGGNLGASTRIFFDGSPATIVSANSNGSLTVAAPPANAPYTAAVEAATNDGQTSLQAAFNAVVPPTFTYTQLANPAISVTPANLLPGTDAFVEIDGVSTNFISGKVAVGFGSSDIFVKQLWVTGSGRVVMNVSLNPQAQAGSVQVTVACGLELLNLTSVMQVQTANPNQITLRAPVLNAATGLAGVAPGAQAVVSAVGLPAFLGAGWTLTVGGQSTQPSMGANGLLYFQIPDGLPTGPAPVQLTSPNGSTIPAILVQIDGPPPVITAATDGSGNAISQSNPATPGGVVILTVSNLTDASGNPAPLRSVRINAGGIDQTNWTELSTTQAGPIPVGEAQLQITLSSNVPYGPAQPIWVAVETRESPPWNLFIQP